MAPAASLQRRLYCCLLICFLLPTIISAQTQTRRRLLGPHDEEEASYSSLSDIFLCMGIAFGWTMFMVRSCSKSKNSMRTYSKEAIPVHGHVLESTVDLENGIPFYRALIDYVYEDSKSGTTYQVRKAFDTGDQLLELGFSNVELLVLPTEPTSGILVKQWKVDSELEQQEEGSQRWQWLTLGLGAIFVLLSSAGATWAVLQLPEDDEMVGWICLVSAIVSLGPLSFVVYRFTTRCYVATKLSVEDGVVIRGKNSATSSHLQHPLDPCDAFGSGVCGRGEKPLRKPWVQQATAASRYYFVCMPQERMNSMLSDISTISSLSMNSIKGDDRNSKTEGTLI